MNPEAQLTSALEGDRQLGAFLLFGSVDASSIAKLRTLLDDPSSAVRDAAGQSLGSLGDAASLARLIELLKRDPPRDTPGIAWAISELARLEVTDHSAIEQSLEGYYRRARGFTRRHGEALLRTVRRGPDT